MKNQNLFWIALLLIILVFFAFYFNQNNFKLENTQDIMIEENKLYFDSLTIEQKIAQMIIVRGDKFDKGFVDLNVGGIFLDRQKNENNYKKLIDAYNELSKIKLFVSTDLEGAWTPFKEKSDEFDFPFFSDILTKEEAFEVGAAHSEILKKIGFNFNFAPVSEFVDDSYGGRVFLGTKENIKQKISYYIDGLEGENKEGVFGSCKHYPGKAMKENLHYVSDSVVISRDDLELFEVCFKKKISGVMVSHQIVSGEIDSKGVPSPVSKDVISNIPKEFLIIADEINMKGLSSFYKDKNMMYIDLINAGNDIILDFELDSRELKRIINFISDAVKDDRISEDKIDESVKKILRKKGYEVV